MASLALEQFADLLTVTLPSRPVPKYTDLGTDLLDAPAAKVLMEQNAQEEQSGAQVKWPINVDNGDSYRHRSVTDHDRPNSVDGFIEATLNWRFSEASYSYYEEEVITNTGKAALVNLIDAKDNRMWASVFEGLETDFWAFPSASDALTPFGLPYWCTKNASTGFNGGIPSGYSAVAGVSPTTYSRWNNYTAQYTNVTLDDFISKVRVMRDSTNFKPLVQTPSLVGTPRLMYASNMTVVHRIADVADSRNDNLGPDVTKMDGEAMINRIMVKRIPWLDRDTTDPFYQIDFGVFKIIKHPKKWKKRTIQKPYPGQRNAIAVFVDFMFNFVCYSRRQLGVLSTGTTYPS